MTKEFCDHCHSEIVGVAGRFVVWPALKRATEPMRRAELCQLCLANVLDVLGRAGFKVLGLQ